MSDNLRTIQTARSAQSTRRAAEAWSLRVAGLSWHDVAQQAGYANAANAVRAVRSYAGSLPAPAHDELRAMMRARSEAVWQQAFADVLQQRPGAVRAAVAVLHRQAQLDGLDAPTRVEITPTEEEFQALVEFVLRAKGVTPVVEYDVLELDDVGDADEVTDDEPV